MISAAKASSLTGLESFSASLLNLASEKANAPAPNARSNTTTPNRALRAEFLADWMPSDIDCVESLYRIQPVGASAFPTGAENSSCSFAPDPVWRADSAREDRAQEIPDLSDRKSTRL